jgi:hypothetical protein
MRPHRHALRPRRVLATLLCSLLLAALPGCGGGGGDTDHPETFDRMVDEARKP